MLYSNTYDILSVGEGMEKKIGVKDYIFLFCSGALAGYVFETVFYILKYGNFVNKQGLIIGPFKPIYGFGVVLITIIFNKLNVKKWWQAFLLGALIGSLFEYLCSYLLEAIWGIYIWDYSNFNFNINGRIYLPYAIIWGLLCMMWYTFLYPKFYKLAIKFDGKVSNIVAILLTIFLVIDFLLTGAVYLRISNSNSDKTFYKLVDKMFPKDKVNKKFSKVRLKKKS